MDLKFRDIYSKSKYFHDLHLLLNLGNKYCKFNISYELSKVTVLAYQDFKKVSRRKKFNRE